MIAVTIWFQCSGGEARLQDELVSVAARNPDECAELESVRELKWSMPSWKEAVEMGERLKPFAARKDVVFLRACNYRGDTKSITYKDERPFLKSEPDSTRI